MVTAAMWILILSGHPCCRHPGKAGAFAWLPRPNQEVRPPRGYARVSTICPSLLFLHDLCTSFLSIFSLPYSASAAVFLLLLEHNKVIPASETFYLLFLCLNNHPSAIWLAPSPLEDFSAFITLFKTSKALLLPDFLPFFLTILSP